MVGPLWLTACNLRRYPKAHYGCLEDEHLQPGKYLDSLGEFSTIEVGKRAGLVLLEADPLEEIAKANQE